MDKLLEVRGLRTYFHTDRGLFRAVDGIDFSVDRGKTVGLVGESGCGKTTAVRAIMGVLAENGRQAGGRVVFKGQAMDEATTRRLRWREALPGAVAAAVLWLVASGGFSLYLRVAAGANRVLGTLGGELSAPGADWRGRYAGWPALRKLEYMERLMRELREAVATGCTVVILTNAAGSLRPEAGPGSLVCISDHINLTGSNPRLPIRQRLPRSQSGQLLSMDSCASSGSRPPTAAWSG